MTETITRVRDGWDQVDESLSAAADRLINSYVGVVVAGSNLGVGGYLVLSVAVRWQSLAGSTSLVMMVFAALLSLSLFLSGFMLAWGDDV